MITIQEGGGERIRKVWTRTIRRMIADGLIEAERFGPRLIRVNSTSLEPRRPESGGSVSAEQSRPPVGNPGAASTFNAASSSGPSILRPLNAHRSSHEERETIPLDCWLGCRGGCYYYPLLIRASADADRLYGIAFPTPKPLLTAGIGEAIEAAFEETV